MAAPRRLLLNAATASSRACPALSSLRARVPLNSPFAASVSACKPPRQAPAFLPQVFRRYNSSSSSSSSPSTRAPKPFTDSNPATPEEEAYNKARRAEEPAYLIYFTCKPCSHRSAHHISKHGYHKGTVLINCPECKNKHVISDHLKIFMDAPVTLEDILAKKGQKLTKGTMEGDMEWWGNEGEQSGSEAKLEAGAETKNSTEGQEGESKQ